MYVSTAGSLISSSVNVMALTATATKSLHREVCNIPGMNNPFLETVSPDDTVSRIIVHITFKPMMDGLRKERVKTKGEGQQQEMCQIISSHLASTVYGTHWLFRSDPISTCTLVVHILPSK